MNRDDAYYDEIHRFLLGEMTDGEAKAFQSRIDEEPTLREALRLEEELQLLVKLQRRAALKQMLKNSLTDPDDDAADAGQNAPQTQPIAPKVPKAGSGGMRPPFWKYIIYGSGLAACLVAAVMLFDRNPAFDQNAAVQRYMAEGSYTIKDKKRNDAQELRNGYVAYNHENWSAAFAQLDTTMDAPEALLMHGVSALHIERWEQARIDFLRLEHHFIPRFADNANWYLALLDLHAQDYAACKKRLHYLIGNKGFQWESAQSLLAELPAD